MHEYGHHIQYQLGITNSPGGRHRPNENLIEIYGKRDGILLSWAEAWATVFGQMAQDYFKIYIGNVRFVNDLKYQSVVSIEGHNFHHFGEGGEENQIFVLWDIFDDFNNNEPLDELSLGHSGCWYLFMNCDSVSFFEFVNYFNTTYSQFEDELSYLLTQNGFTAELSYEWTEDDALKLSWGPQGGYYTIDNHIFQIVFYNDENEVVWSSNQLVEISEYTIPSSVLEIIEFQSGNKIRVSIISRQTEIFVSGPYRSAPYEIDNSIEKMTYTQTSLRFDSIALSLTPGEAVEISINISIDGVYLIQTFGTANTEIAIYNTNMLKLASDFDSGYGTNALLPYQFNGGETFKLRVINTSSSTTSNILVVFTPYDGVNGAHPDVPYIYSYEQIHNISGTAAVYETVIGASSTKVITFTPSVSGTYKFSINCDETTVIYVLDPRSTSRTGNDALGEDGLTKQLTAGVTYFIVYMQLDMTGVAQDGEVVIAKQ